MDSIMARPTNKVRVMVAEASGCCASELKAVETARPSPSAGPTLPRAMVRPAVTIDTVAMVVMLSIMFPLVDSSVVSSFWRGRGLGLASPCAGRNIYRSQDAEDVGLHHAGQQTE